MGAEMRLHGGRNRGAGRVAWGLKWGCMVGKDMREGEGRHPRAAEATGKAVRTPPSSAWGSGAGGGMT